MDPSNLIESKINRSLDLISYSLENGGKLYGPFLTEIIVPHMFDRNCKTQITDINLWYKKSTFVSSLTDKYQLKLIFTESLNNVTISKYEFLKDINVYLCLSSMPPPTKYNIDRLILKRFKNPNLNFVSNDINFSVKELIAHIHEKKCIFYDTSNTNSYDNYYHKKKWIITHVNTNNLENCSINIISDSESDSDCNFSEFFEFKQTNNKNFREDPSPLKNESEKQTHSDSSEYEFINQKNYATFNETLMKNDIIDINHHTPTDTNQDINNDDDDDDDTNEDIYNHNLCCCLL